MGGFYVAGLEYDPDYLMHHGIKGQKWGVRRFQNEDGSLTSEGVKRYGGNLGPYANGKQGAVRKLATGDWLLGKKRGGERREARLERKMKKYSENGKDTSKLSIKYEAQKERNALRDKYDSVHSTGSLFVQKMLLGRSGADAYRVSREKGNDRIKSAVPALIEKFTMLPVSTAISAKVYESELARKKMNA